MEQNNSNKIEDALIKAASTENLELAIEMIKKSLDGCDPFMESFKQVDDELSHKFWDLYDGVSTRLTKLECELFERKNRNKTK